MREKSLDFTRRACYNDFRNCIWSGIEVVITALTRNQVYRQRYRGFESHPLRHRRRGLRKFATTFLCFASKVISPLLTSLLPEMQTLRWFAFRFCRFYGLIYSVQLTQNFIESVQSEAFWLNTFTIFHNFFEPFPSEIQAPKAWHLPRTALCCSPDGRRCLPSWRNRCVPASPESVSSEHHLPA